MVRWVFEDIWISENPRINYLKQSHFDFFDKVLNVLLHVAAGTFSIPLGKSLVYIFHLVEDIFVGDNLAQGGTPQARAAVMKIIQKFL